MTHETGDGLKHGKDAEEITVKVFNSAIKALAKRNVCVGCGAVTLLQVLISNMMADAKEHGGERELTELTIDLCSRIVNTSIAIEDMNLTQLGEEEFDASEYLRKFSGKGKDDENN